MKLLIDGMVIGIRLGNCSTDSIERLLRANHARILAFSSDPVSAFLPLP